MLERGLDDAAGAAFGAADQRDDEADLGVGRHRGGMVKPAGGGDIDAAFPAVIARRHGGDDETASAARGEEVAVLLQQANDAGAHRAEPGYGKSEGRFHAGTHAGQFSRKISARFAATPVSPVGGAVSTRI